MTALELADWIENGAPFGKYETAKQAVIMLRQQQAEIEALKKELALWRLSKSSEEIEATESDKFCDSHCVWTDHHPECKHAKYRR